MRDRLIAILSLMPTTSSTIDGQGKIRSFTSFSDIADYLIANGVIVPPCKVGDTVWVNLENPSTGKKETHQASVYALRFDTKKNNMRICVDGNFEFKAYGGRVTHYYNATFAWNSVGKTVFLTREEAEKALTERSGA